MSISLLKYSLIPTRKFSVSTRTRPIKYRTSLTVKMSAQPEFPLTASISKEQLHSLPGVTANPNPVTKGFTFQQTMLRIKDPKVSLDFYTRVLGMTLLAQLPFPSMKFTLYFLGYENKDDVPLEAGDRVEWMFGRPAVLELTHNHGTESDPEFKGHHNGNSDPRGFGHIGINVPDVDAACKHFEECGVKFVKKPQDGKMKGIAFICDPDGYWIEILNNKNARQFVDWVDPTTVSN